MIIHTTALGFIDTIGRYVTALEAMHVDDLVALFGKDAIITSPLLGRRAPKDFFLRLVSVSTSSRLDRPEVFVSTAGSRRAIGYFTYSWTFDDGRQVSFPCIDVFEFTREGRIGALNIVYDAEPVRRLLGDRLR